MEECCVLAHRRGCREPDGLRDRVHRPPDVAPPRRPWGRAPGLSHARRAAERFDVDIRDVLIELGERKTVGGQEDMIIDVAIEMAKETGKLQ